MHWFTNLKTRTKLTTAFGIVMLLLLLIILTAWSSMLTIRDAERSIADVMTLRSNFNGQRSEQLAAAISPPGAGMDTRLQEVAAYSSDNTAVLERLGSRYREDAELQPYVDQLAAVRLEYMRVRDTEVIPLIREQKKDEAFALILGPQSARVEKFRDTAREFTQVLTSVADTRLAHAELVVGILGPLALLTAIGMIIVLDRLIASPLAKITFAAGRIAEGDLSAKLSDLDRRDEVGQLLQTFQRMISSLTTLAEFARRIADGDLTAAIVPRSEHDVLGNAFASMIGSLRRIMQGLLEAVNVLAASASEIMASTTQLAASAAETAAAVSETTTTVEEVKQTTQISSQQASAVAAESQKAVEVASGGKRAVDQTMGGMDGIRQQMNAVAECILSLSAQSQAIGEIISTVDDLAAQSKLLAVNASIEAAKAGEEGKGFSVVAQEVKSLAEQSKLATTQVRGILSDIQKATTSAVLATEQGSKTVAVGIRQSGAAGETISALAEIIVEAAQTATQIASTSQQQFVGMNQVALAMENIKTASLQTVASTNQAAGAAQQLHDLGQRLKQLVDHLKV